MLDSAVVLDVQPNRCIALHRGQDCYQKLTVSWQTPEVGDYCLQVLDGPGVLQCWQGLRQGQMKLEFADSKAWNFELVEQGKIRSLAEAELELVWVYKRTKKISTGWRLF
ncbi:DUF3019 domain-containing protein [Agaribacterium haliotis]|uniref:DUF3019 domain-containing protein n=1 Tax=Agaribacterium haliotis TaxID=2013869 RepID=UPI00130457BD|nr:DUF3019 domain-containing protein [Agaribacterium haliotis]